MFLAFAWPDYYPGGGKADFVGAFATLDEANTAARAAMDGLFWNCQVYDVAAGEWLAKERGVEGGPTP